MSREQIRAVIKKKGFRHAWLAVQIGVTPSTFSAFLTGKRNLGLAAKKSLFRELELDYEAVSGCAS